MTLIKSGDKRLIDGKLHVAVWEADGLYLHGEYGTWGPCGGDLTVINNERFIPFQDDTFKEESND